MRPTDLRQIVYGVLAVVGLVGTWYFNLAHGSDLSTYVPDWFTTAASSSAAVDLIVAFVAGAVFMVAEGRRVGMRLAWVFPVVGLLVAFAFAFPLFLLLRERALDRGRATPGTPS
ncbi:uncharacterized protein DUF2834 [Pseudonocardia sediminis]|uniref:Uncharacterized protein DUF2834 n=1 Tax=Pseudonocardia sediminis TaxID=1397368 RepID=A0A4Q7UU10_PSEST|nr:DUF2834 domain-containing protein [Pseudonocardia sediminis]RZT85332.1 uncharacterized protein DUF2834 [Pseudonocardia sediminis]